MLINDAFRKAAGLVKEPPQLTEQALARAERERTARAAKVQAEKDMPIGDNVQAPLAQGQRRLLSRQMAKTHAAKSARALDDGSRLSHKERTVYLREIIEDGERLRSERKAEQG